MRTPPYQFSTNLSIKLRNVGSRTKMLFQPSLSLCWLLGTSVLKIDDFALDLLVFLGAVAFTDEGMQAHFVCLHPSCSNMPCSSSPSGRDERVEVSFRLCWLLGISVCAASALVR